MRYEVKFKRMSGGRPIYLLHFCHNIEKAIALTREQYPGCLIISVENQPTRP